MKRSIVMCLLATGIAGAGRAAPPDIAFSFRDPPQVRAIPALNTWFRAEEARLRSAGRAQAAADRADAAQHGYPFHPYETDRTWKVVTDTSRFLSLSLQGYDYSGGAHGMDMFGSLVWDKAAKVRRTTLSFFVSKPALDAATRTAFCRRLDAARARKRRDGPIAFAEFNRCIDPSAQTLILGSTDGRRFDRIGFLIAPYEAGPYAEGSYEVTLPVTAAILGAVRPAWRRYFAPGRP